jgi:hypothetical protein
MNGPVFVAAVVDRSTFKSNNSMVGHENIIEVAVRLFSRCGREPVLTKLRLPGVQPAHLPP